MNLTIDFETRSACDIKKHGAWVYSEDPTTEVLCLACKWEGQKPWVVIPSDKEKVAATMNAIARATTILAHNVSFEAAIWQNVCVKRYGWPPLLAGRLRCSAAKASMHALPRALGNAGDALMLPQQKDPMGYRIMMKMCRPRQPKITEDPNGLYWQEDPKDFEMLYKYCIQDVIAEEALSNALRDLPEKELKIWQLDQVINARGIQVDLVAAHAMLAMVAEHEGKLLKELVRLTNGGVRTAKQVEQLRGHLRALGVDLPDLTVATVTAALKGELPDKVRSILEIRKSLGRSSSAKYKSMVDRASSDGRVRGSLLYHGSSTGRWCTTGDSEVLTPKGWVRLDAWDEKSDAIACWKPEGDIRFMHASKTEFELPGEEGLVQVKSRWISGSYTSEHRIPCLSSRKNLNIAKAEDLLSVRKDVLTSGILKGEVFISDALTRVIVMTQADGYVCAKSGSGRMVRFHFKKTRKIERARAVLEAAGISFRERIYAGVTSIIIRWADAPPEMKTAKTFDSGVLHCNPRVFIDELKYWDGCVDLENSLTGFGYSTASKTNAEWATTMAHLAGMSASVTLRNRQHPGWAPSFRVYIRARTTGRLNPKDATLVPFIGKVYCPITPTGFFLMRHQGKICVTGNSGAGIQPQNFPSRIKVSAPPEEMLNVIMMGGLALHNALYDDDPMSTAGALTRSVLVAAEGKELIAGDYSAIEGRGLAWLAGEESELEVYRSDKDVYVATASMILHKAYEDITKDERNRVGKVATLACGYGGSVGAVRKFGGEGLLDDEIVSQIVRPWREAHPRTVAFWYELERACMSAVAEKGKIFSARGISYTVRDQFLMCRLPPGRLLFYYDPRIMPVRTSWGEDKDSVTYMTVDSLSHKWRRTNTYAGKLAENCTQAICRDIMAEAMLRMEEAGYPIVITVHDEIVCEVTEGFGSVEEFEGLMCKVPEWATGFPIRASGWRGKRYKKG